MDEPSLAIMYFDTTTSLPNQSDDTARRCVAELYRLSEQLTTIGRQLEKDLKLKQLEDVVDMCLLHYEDLLFRTYAMRERGWDVVAAQTGIGRRPTGVKSFRDAVLAKIEEDYTELSEVFPAFSNTVSQDIDLRNVATHQTILFFGLSMDGTSSPLDVDSILQGYDPYGDEGKRLRKLLRSALREFVARQLVHIDRIADLARALYDMVVLYSRQSRGQAGL